MELIAFICGLKVHWSYCSFSLAAKTYFRLAQSCELSRWILSLDVSILRLGSDAQINSLVKLICGLKVQLCSQVRSLSLFSAYLFLNSSCLQKKSVMSAQLELTCRAVVVCGQKVHSLLSVASSKLDDRTCLSTLYAASQQSLSQTSFAF